MVPAGQPKSQQPFTSMSCQPGGPTVHACTVQYVGPVWCPLPSQECPAPHCCLPGSKAVQFLRLLLASAGAACRITGESLTSQAILQSYDVVVRPWNGLGLGQYQPDSC